MPTKQKSGLYRTKVKIGVNADGKPVYKYISGRTKRELEAARQAVIEHYINGTPAARDRLFGDYAVEWYNVRKAPYIRPGTQKSYRSMLNKHILPAFGDRRLKSIQPLELQAFLQTFADTSQSHITIAKLILRGIFASACQDRILDADPTAYLSSPPATKAAEKLALTAEQRATIETTCTTHPNGAFLAVLYYLGLRVGEASALKWGDFDWAARTVRIERKLDYNASGYPLSEPKTEKSKRLLPMPDALVTILQPLRQLPDVLLFTQPNGATYTKFTLYAMWRDLMDAAGLTENGEPTITPHALRHNYITMCYEHGIDAYTAMRLAGHSSINTTLNIYTHLSAEQLERTAESVNEMFAQNKSCTKVAQSKAIK